MTVAIEHRREPRMAAEVVQRRWRMAALIALLVLVGLAGFAAVLLAQSNQANQMVPVLKATKDIRAGSTISADEVGVAYLRSSDQSVLASLAPASDRGQLVGRVAVEGVRAGGLIPAGLGIAPDQAGLWDVNLPIRRMPPDLKAGDHVALVVSGTSTSGTPIEYVVMQDVTVLSVGSGSADLWLPPKVVGQAEWDADHGGIALVRMAPGSAQQNLPAGGPR